MLIIIYLLFLGLLVIVQARTPSQLYGRSLCRLTNDIRIQNGIAPLSFSYTMEYLAQAHLDNLIMNKHDFLNQECNLHSWYPQTLVESKVNISNCCYPQDRCMTSKARELTVNWLKPYSGSAGENSFASMGSGFGGQVSPEWIMESWKSSPNHRSLLLSSTGVVCGAIINTTFSTNAIKNLALLWIGSQDDLNTVEYDGPPILAGTNVGPTPVPTIFPTQTPTPNPTIFPTQIPTIQPTVFPTLTPTMFPTQIPTIQPTVFPTITPTIQPTGFPTQIPTLTPTIHSTEIPSSVSTPIIVMATNETEFVYTEGMYIATQVTVGLLIMCCLIIYIINRYFVKVVPQIHPIPSVPLERNLERNLGEDLINRSLLEQLELEVELDPEIQEIHRRYQRKLRSARRQVQDKILNSRKNYTSLKLQKNLESEENLNETQPKSENEN